ncbi:hypothetical protein [Hoeflea sp.]|uniref:hypothetical protein n=1 Tax=Hoeflea sp. TaxID=1940281 RepID=UPI002AFF7F9D|nr:hypothetical protein [Hoeflea sp.]
MINIDDMIVWRFCEGMNASREFAMTISSTSDNQGARSMIAALSAAFGVPDHSASDLQIEGA